MKLFDVILRLIKQLALVEEGEFNQLHTDVKEYEKTCVPDSKDPVKSGYGKLHKGVLVKLAMPFLYFYLLHMVRELVSPTREDNFLD